jgi:hypothetical protein
MRNYSNPGRSDEPGLAYDFTDTLVLDPDAEESALGATIAARAGGPHPLTVYRLDDVLNVPEAAHFLGLDPGVVVKLGNDGTLPGQGLGMGQRILLADLAAYRVERDQRRRAALAELVSVSEAAGTYD